ncbi:MAG: non-ribosomal peptide synthetase, partial [bacterium]|nr:non-ribosomal peptide synthetase [bacterium]
IEKTTGEKYRAIEPAPKRENYPLSSAQKRLYILQQKDTANTAYNITTALNLVGIIVIAKIENAFKEMIKRHESLRTTFEIVGGQPVQKLHREARFEIEYFETKGDGEIKNFIRPFDLSRAPLLRVGMITTSKQKHRLYLDIHHIISDGTSMGILAAEFMALVEGKTLTPLRVQYKDYSYWQESKKQSEKVKKEAAYWMERYSGELPVIQLPYDYLRPAKPTYAGSQMQFQIEETTLKTLKRIAFEENSTLYMILLVSLNILLAKLSGSEDIVIGTPIEGRRHEDLAGIIGMFVNTLALRNSPEGEKKLGQFIKEVSRSTLKDFENQEYPFEDLVEKLSISGEAAGNPLFDIMFTLQNMEIPHIKIPGVQTEPVTIDSSESKFDMTFFCKPVNEILHFSVEYSTSLFKPGTIQRIITYFKKLLLAILHNHRAKIAQLEIVPEEE